MSFRLLLLTPPLTQVNTPYPATAYLTGFLKSRGYAVAQADLGLELTLKLFSRVGLRRVFAAVRAGAWAGEEAVGRFLALENDYLRTIDPVIRFLQGRDSTLANAIAYGGLLPEGARFDALDDVDWAFGSMGITDRARHLATLYLEDLADLVGHTVGPHFGFSRYAERLARSATSFAPLQAALSQPANLVDTMLDELTDELLHRHTPDAVGFTVPFPGNVYGALRSAQWIKQHFPGVRTLMGGGYVNTELRDINEPAFFDYIDFLLLDDGESPVLRLLEHLAGQRPAQQMHRTYARTDGRVTYHNGFADNPAARDIAHVDVGTPDYTGLPLDRYLSIIEVVNPMHRLWSDGRWNKLTVAHGCYWMKCSFCDTSLDYIGRYDTAPAAVLADRIERVVEQTGQSGFHFVDEAAPPLALRDLALELLRRQVSITWWTNVRFEKTFTPDLCRLLAAAGCIAVSGGLEVASDRLLKLMDKGVTVDQVARVAHSFTDAGIMVHAYLMYGFPTQTAQETIDSLEIVRQLFQRGVIQSGYWHQFAMTAHSPVGRDPARYQVTATGPQKGNFAWNDLQHADPTGADHATFGEGLAKSLYNYLHGVLLDAPLQSWFDFRTPRPTHPPTRVAQALDVSAKADTLRPHARPVWLGNAPQLSKLSPLPLRRGQGDVGGGLSEHLVLTFQQKTDSFNLRMTPALGQWLLDTFPRLLPDTDQPLRLQDLAATFPANPANGTFDAFLTSRPWRKLREKGLVLV